MIVYAMLGKEYRWNRFVRSKWKCSSPLFSNDRLKKTDETPVRPNENKANSQLPNHLYVYGLENCATFVTLVSRLMSFLQGILTSIEKEKQSKIVPWNVVKMTQSDNNSIRSQRANDQIRTNVNITSQISVKRSEKNIISSGKCVWFLASLFFKTNI